MLLSNQKSQKNSWRIERWTRSLRCWRKRLLRLGNLDQWSKLVLLIIRSSTVESWKKRRWRCAWRPFQYWTNRKDFITMMSIIYNRPSHRWIMWGTAVDWRRPAWRREFLVRITPFISLGMCVSCLLWCCLWLCRFAVCVVSVVTKLSVGKFAFCSTYRGFTDEVTGDVRVFTCADVVIFMFIWV